MAARTIELDRSDLDKSIEVLSSAAQALQLTRLERISYRALIVSVDLTVACLIAFNVLVFASGIRFVPFVELGYQLTDVLFDFSLIIFAILPFAIVTLALNVPLFLKAFRERARLKTLGLSSLSRSLWKESRRSRWISRFRGIALMAVTIYVTINGLTYIWLYRWGELNASGLILAIILAFLMIMLCIATRYLQSQRERMDLTANAEGLRKTFERLLVRADKSRVVTVPSELVEQTTKIESAQIASERKNAILKSITSPGKEYAVEYDHEAAKQRKSLSIADRSELEKLFDELSTEGTKLAAVVLDKEAVQRAATNSKRVEIDYLIDHESHRIRVTAVRQRAPASTGGASHA